MPTRDQKTIGRELRYRLTLILLEAPRPLTVAQLLADLDRQGHAVPGRPSKTLSDALRWEIRRGRVRRTARATYEVARIPESTVRWMRGWLEARG